MLRIYSFNIKCRIHIKSKIDTKGKGLENFLSFQINYK